MGWNEVMYSGFKSSNAASVLYFILLQLFGVYLILNLFLAILIQGFSKAQEDNASEQNAKEKKEQNERLEKDRLAKEKLVSLSRHILNAQLQSGSKSDVIPLDSKFEAPAVTIKDELAGSIGKNGLALDELNASIVAAAGGTVLPDTTAKNTSETVTEEQKTYP